MERKKKITNYTILMDNKLGEGAFGKVYVGEQDHTKLKVAIKVLEKKSVDSDDYIKSALFSEIEVLKCLKSPNIVGFLDVMESNNYYYIIQEFCDGGELRQAMKKKGKIPEKDAVVLLMQICNGFVELIKQGVMHRDLKPENVLLHQGILKIADFGFAKKGQQLKKVAAQTMVGTPLYMSLQVLKSKPYSSKCDIWSLGFIFYEMLMGRTPWTGNSEYELIKNIQKQPLTFPVQISQTTKDFIRKCVALEEKDRFSWDDLLIHPIFKGYFSAKNKLFENKYKTIMNHIRFQVKSKNIDLENIFHSMGYTKNKPMIYQSFNSLMLGIDSELTEQQIKYIFKQINVSGSGAITFQEFDNSLNQFGVPTTSTIKSHDNQQPAKNNSPADQKQIDPNVMRQQVNLKVANAFHKLIVKLNDQKNTLFNVFDYYKLTQKGSINIADYDKLMLALDSTFTKPQIQLAFSFFDKNGTKNVSLKQFINYFTNVTGQVPVQNGQGYFRKDSNNSDTSYTHTVGMQYPTSPLYGTNQYNQQGGQMNQQQQLAYFQQQQQLQALQGQSLQGQQPLQGQYGYATTPGYGNNSYGNQVYNNAGYGYQTDVYGMGYRM